MTDPGQQDAPGASHEATGTGAGLPDWRLDRSTDPDAPLLAVLAAADRAAPRVRRVPGAAMVAGRFEVPPPRKPLWDPSDPPPITDTLAKVADEHRRIGQRMWDAVTRGMRGPDTQRDYLAVQ